MFTTCIGWVNIACLSELDSASGGDSLLLRYSHGILDHPITCVSPLANPEAKQPKRRTNGYYSTGVLDFVVKEETSLLGYFTDPRFTDPPRDMTKP